MDKSALLTICIPTYNAEKTILETLTSLKNQSYNKFKIKVYDNCSTDSTVQVVEEFKKSFTNIEIIINEENIGAEANFTKCIQGGETKYTAIYHSDDIYFPDIVKKQLEVLESDKNIGAVSTNAIAINENSTLLKKRFTPSPIRPGLNVFSKKSLLGLIYKYANFITCPSVMARTDIYQEHIKEWRGNIFKSSADLDVWIRISEKSNFAFLNEHLIGYREAEASYSFRIAKKRVSEHDLFKVLEFYKENATSTMKDDLYFLYFKDITLRSINLIRTCDTELDFPNFNYSWIKIFEKGAQSKWHMKIFIAGLLIYLTRPLLSRRIRRIICEKK